MLNHYEVIMLPCAKYDVRISVKLLSFRKVCRQCIIAYECDRYVEGTNTCSQNLLTKVDQCLGKMPMEASCG